MSVFASVPTRRTGGAPAKKTLDREHARLAPSFETPEDEHQYYQDTAHILFHYYDYVEKGGGNTVSQNAPVEQTPVGSHKVTVGMRQQSVLDFIQVKRADDEEPNQPEMMEEEDSHVFDLSRPDEVSLVRQPSGSKYSSMSRADLLNTFMKKVDRDYAPEPDKTETRYMKKNLADVECEHCGSKDRVLVPNEGFLHCLECDTIEYVTLDSERPSYRDPPRELSYFCYKRANHLQEWISQTQGREYTNIPEHVYDAIMLELKKQKIRNLANLERKKLREVLKKLGMNKHFEHLNHIYTHITGKQTVRIPPNIEAQFKRMFTQIQVPFIKHAPPNRRNHLSYSYCLSRFADLLGYDEIQEYLPKLKSKQKREEQNRLCKHICGDLSWEYHPQE